MFSMQWISKLKGRVTINDEALHLPCPPGPCFIMRSMGKKKPDDNNEYFDDADTMRQKAQGAAELLRRSKHAIAFTGAGISTAAGTSSRLCAYTA